MCSYVSFLTIISMECSKCLNVIQPQIKHEPGSMTSRHNANLEWKFHHSFKFVFVRGRGKIKFGINIKNTLAKTEVRNNSLYLRFMCLYKTLSLSLFLSLVLKFIEISKLLEGFFELFTLRSKSLYFGRQLRLLGIIFIDQYFMSLSQMHCGHVPKISKKH